MIAQVIKPPSSAQIAPTLPDTEPGTDIPEVLPARPFTPRPTRKTEPDPFNPPNAEPGEEPEPLG